MTPTSRYSLIVLAALSVPAGAHVRAHHDTPSVPPDAHASAMPAAKVEMYKQCEEMARLRWGTNGIDMQRPRDFLYHSCMYDHGMRNP